MSDKDFLDEPEEAEQDDQPRLAALVSFSAAPQQDLGVVPSDFGTIPSFWGLTPGALEGVRRARAVQNTRHGMMAGVPMICQGEACKFVKTCYLARDQRPVGGRCPIEIAAIIDRFDTYCTALNVTEQDVVDMGMIKELVDIEIQLLRADNKMAMDGDFTEMVIASIDNKGNPYYKPELTKAVDYKEILSNKKHKILQLLNSTRKDREAGKVSASDPSVMAAALMQKVQELEAQGKLRTIIEITPEPTSEEGGENHGRSDPELV